MLSTVDEIVEWAYAALKQAKQADEAARKSEAETNQASLHGRAEGIRSTVESILGAYFNE